jgi:hypothetical protein
MYIIPRICRPANQKCMKKQCSGLHSSLHHPIPLPPLYPGLRKEDGSKLTNQPLLLHPTIVLSPHSFCTCSATRGSGDGSSNDASSSSSSNRSPPPPPPHQPQVPPQQRPSSAYQTRTLRRATAESFQNNDSYDEESERLPSFRAPRYPSTPFPSVSSMDQGLDAYSDEELLRPNTPSPSSSGLRVEWCCIKSLGVVTRPYLLQCAPSNLCLHYPHAHTHTGRGGLSSSNSSSSSYDDGLSAYIAQSFSGASQQQGFPARGSSSSSSSSGGRGRSNSSGSFSLPPSYYSRNGLPGTSTAGSSSRYIPIVCVRVRA